MGIAVLSVAGLIALAIAAAAVYGTGLVLYRAVRFLWRLLVAE